MIDLDRPGNPPIAEIPLPQGLGMRIRWAPDGRRLRFTAARAEGGWTDAWVWEASLDHKDPRPLWPGWGGDWSPDGRYFVFERAPDVDGRWDIYAAPQGRPGSYRGDPVALTRGPASFTEVGFHPNGKALVGYGWIARGELQHFDRRARRFEPYLDGESVGLVRPSPDGRWLAWVRYPEGTLWRSRRDGGERLRLTTPPGSAFLPAWSPDSRWIAFVGHDSNDVGDSLRLVPVEGGEIQVLAQPEAGASFWDPCWLPDGQTIVFGDRLWSRQGIRTLDVTTRRGAALAGAEDLVHPRCGPEGQLLAVRPPDDPSSGDPGALVVYWPNDGAWEVLAPNSLAFPTWTRDGRSFCGLDLVSNRIECYSFATRRFETLAELGDRPLLTWGWIRIPWFGLDPDDNPLVMIDRSTRDLYALDWENP